MTQSDAIRNFEYRLRRTKITFAVDYVVSGQMFHGISGDISDTGVRVELDSPDLPVLDSVGLLILRHPAGTIKLEARVAYVGKCQIGLIFLFQTAWERGVTSDFVESIAKY